MKNLFLILLILMTVVVVDSKAQCDAGTYTNECIPLLPDGFNFLKSYSIDGQGGAREKVEYSYVFTKGTQYMINLCGQDGGTDGLIVSLFDSRRNQVATSSIGGQFAKAIAFPCNTTGIYYISYSFQGSSLHCGGSALGFSKS